jgi:hypothetical protein
MRMLLRLLLMGSLVAIACTDGDRGPSSPERVEAVIVEPNSMVLVVGERQPLAVTVYGRNGWVLEGRAVAWTMTAGAVVSVDAAGVVTALAAGAVTLTATSEGVAGRATITVHPEPEVVDPVEIRTGALADAIQGQAYGQRLEAAGGSGGYGWVLAAGTLPSGLTLSPAGAISGTPAGAGTSSFRVRAMDAGGRSATAELSLQVVPALAVQTGALPDAEVGSEYAGQLQAAGGRGTLTWSLADDTPSCRALSPAGALSGSPATAGAALVTVLVADDSGQQATRQLALVIRAPLAVVAITLPTGTQGQPYAAQLVATGGDGAYSWSLDGGALPAGLAVATGGAVAGTPTAAGTFSFTVRVRDGAGRSATRSLPITVYAAPAIQTASLPAGEVGTPYVAQLQATGGTGAYTWSVTQGALPAGLTLTSGGSIAGTPAALGSSTFTVRVTDEAGAVDARAFTLVVAPVEELSNGVPVTGISGEAGSMRFYAIQVPAGAARLIVSVAGGTGDVDLYVRRGGLPQEYVYDCRPFRPGNEETCTFVSPAAGAWYIMLRGYAAYAGVSLVARVEE